MKIRSNNMPSIHKIYEYGNIAIEELFDIDNFLCIMYFFRNINENIIITLSFCYKTQWKWYPECLILPEFPVPFVENRKMHTR